MAVPKKKRSKSINFLRRNISIKKKYYYKSNNFIFYKNLRQLVKSIIF